MVDGLRVSYDLIGELSREGHPWVITPGGRFSKDYEGVRELAQAIAAEGNQVLVWDRPNCGESDVCFTGTSESAMQADVLAGLLRAARPGTGCHHRRLRRFARLAADRCAPSGRGRRPRDVVDQRRRLRADEPRRALLLGIAGRRLDGGMDAVLDIPDWVEVLERNPGNRQRFLDQDPQEFVETMERWMAAYCACGEELIPGLPDADARSVSLPTLVFRSGKSDVHHTRATSESLAALLPNTELVEPPWGDREWIERGTGARSRRREPVLPLAPARPHAHRVGRQGVGLALNPR